MLSSFITLVLGVYDFIVWGVLGFSTIEVVESVSNLIYYLEGLGL